MAGKILVVDDDPHIREVVVFALEKAGLKAIQAKDGAEAVRLVRQEKPQLMVLDINMPEMDGLAVCREIRKASELPILFLSSRDEEVDRIIGLEIGGDDYVTKPFSPRELVARVNAILKRSRGEKPSVTGMPKRTHGLLELEPEKHKASWKGQAVDLTATEFQILDRLLQHPERVFDRDSIMDGAYRTTIYVSHRTIDSHIRHIRQKFASAGCDSLIETVHGVGYKLGSCA